MTRPPLIVASAALFVAAVYTKQTSIVAPAAVFLTFLLLRPRLAWALAASCVVIGLVVLGALQLATDGGFVRHIFLYNVNRFDPSRLPSILAAIMRIRCSSPRSLIGVGDALQATVAAAIAARAASPRCAQRLRASPGDASSC